MKSVFVKSVYPVDTISRGNNKVWEKLKAYLEEVNEPILFDFKDIVLKEPWESQAFLDLLRDKRFFMQLRNDKTTMNNINIYCRLVGGNEDKAENISSPVVKEMSAYEMRSFQKGGEMLEFLDTSTNPANFNLYKKMDLISSERTVNSIRSALEQFYAQGSKLYRQKR